MEPGCTEVLLAQKLSCGDPRIRKKAFSRLEQRINAQSIKSQRAAKDDVLKIWKGLYYCFWLQDKPLLQEALVDNITRLLGSIKNKEQKLLFLECFYEEFGKEWHSVDQWRMNKFLMFFRRMFRRILEWLKQQKFNRAEVDDVFALLRKFVLNSKADAYPAGLKLHFVSIFMDELDNAGAGVLSPDQTFDFLSPFLDLLNQKSTDDALFDAILNDVFKSILEYCAEDLNKSDEGSSAPILQLDLPRIKCALFDLGKSKNVTSKRRMAIYALVTKFDQLISGEDPFCEEISDVEGLDESDVDQAAFDLVKFDLSENTAKTKKRKVKRIRCSVGSDGEDFDDNHNDEPTEMKKTKKLKKIKNREMKTNNKFKRAKSTRVK